MSARRLNIRGLRSTFPPSQQALSARIARLYSSGRRLPYRLARAARVALDILRWTFTFQLRAGLRRRRDARLLRRSGLFDCKYYLAQSGGDPAARRDPHMHYLESGAAQGLDPSPLFDTSAYADCTPAARGENPLVHLLRSRAPPRLGDDSTPRPAPAWYEDGLAAARLFRAPPAGDERRDVLVVSGDSPALALLESEGYRYRCVLLSGAHAQQVLPAVRAHAPQATVVYDAREDCTSPGASPRGRADRTDAIERVVLACVDLVLVPTSDAGDRILRQVPGARVAVKPEGRTWRDLEPLVANAVTASGPGSAA